MTDENVILKNWFYMENDKQVGPIHPDSIRPLVTQGKIKSDTPVWSDGLPNWMNAIDTELAFLFSPPSPPAISYPKCVECGNPATENAETIDNPLCKPCFTRIEKEHSTDKQSSTKPKTARTPSRLIKVLFTSILVIVGLVLVAYFYDSSNGGTLSFSIFHKKTAIELVRKSKMIKNVLVDKTVEDITKEEAERGAQKGKQYEWTARPVPEEKGFAIVGFIEKGTSYGKYWEVDLSNKIVRFINSNIFLSMKYGFSRFHDSGEFQINAVTLDTLKYIKLWVNREATWVDMIYDGRRIIKNKIVYYFRGSVKNNTDKVITDATIKCQLYLIFNVDKIVEIDQYNSSAFSSPVSSESPWQPGESRDFRVEMDPIDGIYKDYNPSKVFFEFNLAATDPVGYEFDWVIKQQYLQWHFTSPEGE